MSVTDWANNLETSEYDVFCRAYAGWYGHAVNTREVERDFARYLRAGSNLPCYVRAFLQRVYVMAA